MPRPKAAPPSDLESFAPWIPIAEDPENESTIWRNPETGFEIAMTGSMKPTPAVLKMLAANGVFARRFETGENFDELEPEPEETATDRILTMMGQADPEERAEIKVYRIREGKPDIYCGKFSPAEFEEQNLELIRANFGGGTFRLCLYGTTPKIPGQKHGGKFVVLAKQVVEIEQSLIPPKVDGQAAPAAMMPIMERLFQRLENLEQRSTTGNDLASQLMILKQLQELTGGNRKEKSIAEQLAELEALKQFKDNTLGGSDSGESGNDMMGALNKVLDVVKVGLSNKPAAPTTSAPYAANPAALVPTIEPPAFVQAQTDQPQTTEGEPVNVFQNVMLTTTLNILCQKAAQNADIEPIASDMADRLPDEVIDQLDSLLWFDVLKQFHPPVANFEDWFTRLRDRILALLDEPGPAA